MTDEIDYTHGDTGSQPPDGNDFQADERPQASYFDWYIDTFVSKINSLVGDVSDIISGTQKVGNADQVDGQDYSDIQNWVETSAKASDADTVDGYEASQLIGGEGGFNLPSTDLPNGDFTALARMPFGSNTTLEVAKTGCFNGSFNAPSGLNLVIYDETNNTVLASYNGYNDVSDPIDVSDLDVIIAADNGNFGTGTGSTEENVTAFITSTIE